ncbi:MAG: alpha-hydroxy-acid oxidizing protein [Mycobacterium sp.]
MSAAAGDGRTQRANIAAFSRYGIVPRMMVSPPERDLSIQLFGKHLVSPMFLCPIGLVGLCAPDFHGDVAAAQASASTGVPFTLSTFTQTPMEEVIKHADETPSFFQLYLTSTRSMPLWRRASQRQSFTPSGMPNETLSWRERSDTNSRASTS